MIDIGPVDKANALARIQKGLLSVPALSAPGVEAHEFVPVVRNFCISYELEKAAKKFGEAYIESELQPVFTELERLELKDVPWLLTPSQVLEVAGQRPAGWKYVSHFLPGNNRPPHAVAVVGTFNKAMRWCDMDMWSGDHDLSGSGAWVRAAYLRDRPDYDGKGAIAFPDGGTSLWADLHEMRGDPKQNHHFPGLWHDAGKCGIGSLDWAGDANKWSAGRRVVFIERQQRIIR